eukprot:scaffold4982_cov24-Phaeocystis_antarctica.AAC.2
MSEAELLTFSDYSLHFANGVTLPFGPRQYGYELRRGVWCDPHLHTSLAMGHALTLPHHPRSPERCSAPRSHPPPPRPPCRCLGIFDNEHNGAVIGGANMRNNEVTIDPSPQPQP